MRELEIKRLVNDKSNQLLEDSVLYVKKDIVLKFFYIEKGLLWESLSNCEICHELSMEYPIGLHV